MKKTIFLTYLYTFLIILFVPGVTLAQWQPQTNAELQTAVDMWVDDNETALATYGEINTWDVSLITDMYEVFRDHATFNDDISNWDVSNVMYFSFMFYNAAGFNQDLTNWDVSSANSMMTMFKNASSFNGDLSNWDLSGLTTNGTASMFSGASNFNQDISNWDVSHLENIAYMFANASSFNQDLSSWDVSNVTSLWYTFDGATSFNQDISGWNTANLELMEGTFRNASNFNQDISGWDVSGVTHMDYIFDGADALSDGAKCAIHTSFSEQNDNWPYDWSDLCVEPPEISVTPSSLSLELNEGETGTQTLTISNTGGESLEVTLSIDDGTVTDIDGNVYQTVEIGERVWMKENLKVMHYNDGSEIPTGYSNDDWINLSTGAYAVYNDDTSNVDIYGNLYNWYAVDDSSGVCPEGWNVPTDDEYTELTNYLGGLSVAGGKLKECTEGSCPDSEYWDSPNAGATNESGFTGLPGGYRYFNNGNYLNMGSFGYFWSSTEYGNYNAWYRILGYYNSEVNRGYNYKSYGFSVRCIRDLDYLTILDSDEPNNEAHRDGDLRDEWLTLSDYTLTIPSGSSEDIIVTFNAESLEIGEYDADIIISSNDPDNSPLNVPVSLTVELPNTPPVAGFSWSAEGLMVTFTNTSTDADDDTLTYSWDFGEDSTSTSTETNPSHTYASAGTYTVSLTASDGTDENTYSEEVTVTIPPEISVTPNALSLELNEGETGTQTLTISNTGEGPLEVTLSIDDGSTVTDIDGNVYQTVEIGERVWMKENLKVTHYNDGSEIPTGYSNDDWINLSTGASAVYNDDSSNVDIYGNLYNWYTVEDDRGVCPEGWNVPTDDEYTELSDYLGGTSVAGGKLKECTEGSCPDSEYWNSPNTGATNESGFTGLPGGYRDGNSGNYYNMGTDGTLWSSTENGNGNAWDRLLYYSNSEISRHSASKRNGFSVRCIRDLDYLTIYPDGVGIENVRDEWLTLSDYTLTIPSGSSEDIIVTFNAESLEIGEYDADIIISSNDPDNSPLNVSVNLTVELPNTPPVAGFDWEAEDLTVTFTNTSTDADGDTLTYSWDFGEDSTSTSTETNPSHTYASVGTYTVSLTATDGTDNNTYSEEVTVSLPGPPEITVTPSALSLELNEGETGTQTLTISNTGGESLEVTLSIDDGTVTDIDGNVYQTVEIGERVWMKENLKVMHYNDGSEIPTGYSNDDWINLSTGAYAVYDDIESNANTYGNLYNWYAVEDDRGVCPEGWNVPTDDEYTELTNYLGGLSVAGGKLKECTPGSCPDSEYWNSPNTGATNESGFTGLPGGNRNYSNGYYNNMGSYGYFWSSTEFNGSNAWSRRLDSDTSQVDRGDGTKSYGYSVRCIRDVDYLTILDSDDPNSEAHGDGDLRDEWLTLSEYTLTIPAGSSETVEVTFDATELEIGEHDADIIISSNDPDNSPLNVPVSLTVELPNTPPVAGFSWSAEGLMVTFTNTSTDADGDTLTYSWDFGDGGMDCEDSYVVCQNECQEYYNIGINNCDDAFTSCAAECGDDEFCIEDCSMNYDMCISESADMQQTCLGDCQLSYDECVNESAGGTSTETNPSYIYASAGTYIVSLTAFDGADNNTYSEEVTVSLPSPPEILVTPDALSLELNEGETGTQTLTISNTGGESLEVTLSIDDGTVTDIDGNEYKTVLIGNQLWMAENLKVTHYNDGSEIPTGYSNDDWANLSTGASAVYNDDTSNVDIYGYLYNWYAVEDDRGVCPEGWNVPTDDEYTELSDYLGGTSVAGGKLKECTEGSCPESEHWNSPNEGATNESGFTGLPGGYGYGSGYYFTMGNYGYFWSSTEGGNSNAWHRKLSYGNSEVGRYGSNKRSGFSVRCLRDLDYLTILDSDEPNNEAHLDGNFRDEWLTLSADSLVIPPNSSYQIDVTFNGAVLTGGDYSADIVMTSNDPDNSPLNVPVSLTVNEEDGEPLVIESETILSLIGRLFVDNQSVVMDTLGNGDILRDIVHSPGPGQHWDLNELMFFPGQVDTVQYLEFTEDVPQFDNDSLAMCNFVERRYGSSEDPDSTWDNYIYSYVGIDTLRYLGEYEAVSDVFQQNLILPTPLPVQYGDSLSVTGDFFGMEMNLEYSVDRWGDLIYEDESLPVLGQTSIFWMAPPDSMPEAVMAGLTFLDEDYLTAVQMMAFLIPSEEEEPSEITEIYMVLHDYDEMYFGCIDSTASNYDFTATIDDGSCNYVEMAVVDSTTGAITDTLVVSSGSGDVELTIDAGTVLILDGDTVMVNLDIVVSDFSADSITATIDDSTELASDIVAFEPFGLTFSAPVEISIAYNSSRSDFRLMMLDNELDDTWEEVDADCSDGNCNAGVLSFGLFSVQDMDPPLSIDTQNNIPETFVLKQNFPNPFNPITTLQYGLPRQSYVTLTIYNMLGIKIKQLVNRTQQAGFNSVQWDATDSNGRAVSAGVYFYQIQAGDPSFNSGQGFVQTKKMVLLK